MDQDCSQIVDVGSNVFLYVYLTCLILIIIIIIDLMIQRNVSKKSIEVRKLRFCRKNKPPTNQKRMQKW